MENSSEIVSNAGNTDPTDGDDQSKLINEDEKESLEELHEEEEEEPLIIVRDNLHTVKEPNEKTTNKDKCEFVEIANLEETKLADGEKQEDSFEISSQHTSPLKDEKLDSNDIELIERQSAQNKIIISSATESQKSSKQQPSSSMCTEKTIPATGETDLASSIWIRNITSSTKAADLKVLFTKHGKVLTAKIFTTKNKQNPTCFGYVTLTDPETADICVENANRLNFKGRVIHVEKADRSNLSQINNNNSTSQQQQQSPKTTSKSEKNHRGSTEIMEVKPKGSDSKRSSSSTAKGFVRPRITATGREAQREREPASTNWRATNYHSGRERHEGRSRMVAYARSRPMRTYDNGHGYKQPVDNSTDQNSQYPVRHIVQTSRGVRVTTFPYNSSSARVAEADSSHSHRNVSSHHSSSNQNHGQSNSASVEKDREEILRMMRRREEEHRKKEEELRLERERERLKYEREKLEREKLELETYKLHAQLAQAAHLQIAGLPAATALTAPATAAALIGSTSATVHHPFMQPHQQQFLRGDTTGSSSTRRNEMVPPKNERKMEKRRSSKDDTSTSRRHYAREDHNTRDRRNVQANDNRGRDARSKRSRSRSPHRRQETVRGGKNDRNSLDTHRDMRGVSRYDRFHEETSQTKIGSGVRADNISIGGKQQTQRNDDQYNKGSSFYYGAGNAPAARNYVDQGAAQIRSGDRLERRASPPTTRAREFFATNDRFGHNLATDTFNARTDPSYASRIGGQSNPPIGNRSAEEMFGNTGFLQQRQGDEHYISQQQQQYRREQLSNSSNSNQFFQPNPSAGWDSSNKGASNNAGRSYMNTGTTGVWNSGADWNSNTYGTNNSSTSQQGQSTSGNRFQTSYGKPGSSYSTGGRRY